MFFPVTFLTRLSTDAMIFVIALLARVCIKPKAFEIVSEDFLAMLDREASPPPPFSSNSINASSNCCNEMVGFWPVNAFLNSVNVIPIFLATAVRAGVICASSNDLNVRASIFEPMICEYCVTALFTWSCVPPNVRIASFIAENSF